jgi:PleD family two-component response regulator
MQITKELRSNISPAVEGELDASRRPFKILVADDSPIDRKDLEHALREEHYSARSPRTEKKPWHCSSSSSRLW